MKNKFRIKNGFTLIEVMVATAIFTIIMTAGIGAILNANTAHKTNQNQRSILDNLNFAMEDMARNLRLGSNYFCFINPNDGGTGTRYNLTGQTITPNIGSPTQNCPQSTSGIGFEPTDGDLSDPNNQFIYVISDVNPENIGNQCSQSNPCHLWKSMYSGGPDPNTGLSSWKDTTPANIELDPAISGFTVIGSDNQDNLQPIVLIRLAGVIRYKDIATPFNLQTTVVQRATDVRN